MWIQENIITQEYSHQVLNLSNCAMKLYTETSLSSFGDKV